MSVFSTYISTNNDNGYLWPSGPTWYNSDPNIGKTGLGTAVNSAIRFQNVTIGQGATITSAKLTVQCWFSTTRNLVTKISGIDEDNTATLTSNPFGRSETTAKVDWDQSADFSADTEYDSSDITSVVQEIVDRGGWSSGNAMGFFIKDDGSASDGNQNYFYGYSRSSTRCFKLTIEYSGSSPSASPSPSSSPSSSISLSPSSSISPSASPSPSIAPSFTGLKIAKPGYNILEQSDPNLMVFNSDYSTLKYSTSGSLNLECVVDELDQEFFGVVNHSLGEYRYIEAYVLPFNTGEYQPIPFLSVGASTAIWYSILIGENSITFGIRMQNYTFDTYNFTFKYFIFKNKLVFA